MLHFRILLAVTCLCVTQSVIAQNIRLSYFGETITHYGLRGGMEYSLAHTEKTKTNGASVRNDLMFGLTLTAFRHPDNYIGVILAPELGWRRTGKRGGIVQAAVSTGLFRSFYEAKTYRTGENGEFTEVPLGGQWGFMPGVSLGMGKDLSVRHDKPVILFTNVHYMRQYPYNGSSVVRPALEAGIIWKNNKR